MSSINDFLNEQRKMSEERYRLSNWTLSKIGTIVDVEQLPYMDVNEIIDLVIKLKPTCAKSVTNYLYMIGQYDKFCHNEDAYKTVLGLNRSVLFKQCQEVNHIQKFISNETFEDWVFNIEMHEELNVLYYSSLVRCLYEGIYSDDMSVIKNLRGSDIHGNVVTLREDDGSEYSIEISSGLAEDLFKMSMTDIWERKNRYGTFPVGTEGVYSDSCFKIEHRGGNNYRHSYFTRISKMSKAYMDYSIRPLYLYISGMMYRIKTEIEGQGFDLKFAFIDNNRFPLTCDIVKRELDRCHYLYGQRNFRQIVNGYIDVF